MATGRSIAVETRRKKPFPTAIFFPWLALFGVEARHEHHDVIPEEGNDESIAAGQAARCSRPGGGPKFRFDWRRRPSLARIKPPNQPVIIPNHGRYCAFDGNHCYSPAARRCLGPLGHVTTTVLTVSRHAI